MSAVTSCPQNPDHGESRKAADFNQTPLNQKFFIDKPVNVKMLNYLAAQYFQNYIKIIFLWKIIFVPQEKS